MDLANQEEAYNQQEEIQQQHEFEQLGEAELQANGVDQGDEAQYQEAEGEEFQEQDGGQQQSIETEIFELMYTKKFKFSQQNQKQRILTIFYSYGWRALSRDSQGFSEASNPSRKRQN